MARHGNDARPSPSICDALRRGHTRGDIRAAVTLSHRYITARQLPDKAIVILLKQADRILGQALIGSSAHDSLESDAGLASEGLIHLPDAFALFATY